MGTLIAASVLAGVLSVLGLLLAMVGSARDERIEHDLIAQGVGPRGLRAELRMRLVLGAGVGVGAGLVVAVVLTRLAVAGVRAVGPVDVPRPPPVTVVPWAELAAWGLAAMAMLALVAVLASTSLVRQSRLRPTVPLRWARRSALP
jgi:hypothetical protein